MARSSRLAESYADPRLINWNDNYLKAITEETEMFIAEILRENHALDTFIDPDFHRSLQCSAVRSSI